MNIPVIETEGYQGSSEVRLDARFLKDHKVFLLGEITPDTAVELTQKLIYLENEPSAEQIKLYINSPGGEISSRLLKRTSSYSSPLQDHDSRTIDRKRYRGIRNLNPASFGIHNGYEAACK